MVQARDQEKRELLEYLLREEGVALDGAPRIASRGDSGPAALSYAQQRLWFLDQLEPGTAAYNVPFGVRLTGGSLDGAVLSESLREVERRHEVLRTRFVSEEGEPRQVIEEEPTCTLEQVDLTHLGHEERELAVRRLAEEKARQPFDLAREGPLRARLLRLGEAEHVLLLTLHHIASDGWSVPILFRELSELYTAFERGERSPLSELPIQYGDFAAWQREWLSGEALERELTYWREQLGGELPLLELSTDRPRPAVQTFDGAVETRVLPKALGEGLRALGGQERATLFMTLLAAYQALLSRYTGQKSIAVGSPVAGRNRVETEGLIGFFVNTLVLYTDLGGDPSFRELLGRVREVCLGAYSHQEVPFEKLVEELQPERQLHATPLFQTMFMLEEAMSAPSFAPFTLSPLPVHSGTAKFDLTLAVADTAEGLHAALEYNTSLFEAATIQRMLEHFQTLLEGVVADPEQRIGDLPLLMEAERARVLVEWNETAEEYPRDRCIHELFEEQVKRTPDAVAVVFEDEPWTYGDLDRRANQVAHALQRLGVGPDALVGICLARSLEMLVAVLGVLKAGGAYVPLDPDVPSQRLSFMIEESGLAVLLTQQSLEGALPPSRSPVLRLDADWPSIAQESEEPCVASATAQHLAYVMYTSGSTGTPKGVAVAHGAVVNFLGSMRREPGLTAQDTLLAVTTLSFDISVLELLLPLSVGGRVVVASREVAADGAQLQSILKDSGATVMQATPATWQMLRDARWEGQPTLKVLCGGEALRQDLAGWLLERVGSLWNLYGPTETTVWSTVQEIRSLEGPITVGRPIANTEIYLLDEGKHPVPIGVPGELYIGGAGLARGYWKRPELTAERFVAHPFSEEPGARLYRTGDRARYRQDGAIEVLGRQDHQVKLRGYRIELGEIETVLAEHGRVQHALVMLREDRPGDPRLVAYVVAPNGEVPPSETLLRHLRPKLPHYMIPSAFVPLDALPLTPNGKIDRRALPSPEPTRADPEHSYVAPRTTVEREIANIWSEVLGVERIGVHDDFFHLGGHSLLATQAISRLCDAFEVALPLRSLFEFPTVEGLMSEITQRKALQLGEIELAQILMEFDEPSDAETPSKFTPI